MLDPVLKDDGILGIRVSQAFRNRSKSVARVSPAAFRVRVPVSCAFECFLLRNDPALRLIDAALFNQAKKRAAGCACSRLKMAGACLNNELIF
jgi:hypothetical protein